VIDPLKIKALYEEGYGTRLIAKRLGCIRHTITYHLSRLQVPLRTAAEGQALYLARQVPRTEEERRIAQLQTYKKYDRMRRHLGKDLNKWERKLMLSLQRRMK
jgi:IS30 family transposase